MKSSYWLFGSKLTVLEKEETTDSEFDLIEGLFLPGAIAPLHVHAKYSETFYLLEGEATIYVPGQTIELKAGDTYYIPKNVPHTIINNSDTHAFRALCVANPGGFAKLISAVGFEDPDENNITPPEGKHDMELAMKICAEIGDTILGPPGARP